MPRAIWTGSISFGLVNVPVRLYSAIERHNLHFHYLHTKDESRIGYDKVCKAEGKPVPDDEIVKAFEYEKGKYVYMTDEDFDEAKVEGFKTIDVRDFVPYEQIDPIFFRKTYYVGPQDGAERTYALLREAMAQSGLAGIVKFLMRDRQNLGCLRVRDDVITLEQLYFGDEVRSAEDVAPPGNVDVDSKQLDMAAALIESFAGEFDPSRYKDTYRDALCEVIAAKRSGKEIHLERRVADQEEPADLMAALRQSVERARREGRSRLPREDRNRLESLTKDELYERAQRADIPGRSEMTKDELVEALRAA